MTGGKRKGPKMKLNQTQKKKEAYRKKHHLRKKKKAKKGERTKKRLFSTKKKKKPSKGEGGLHLRGGKGKVKKKRGKHSLENLGKLDL